MTEEKGRSIFATASIVWCDDCAGLRWVHVATGGVVPCESCNRFAGLRGVEAVNDKAALELHALDCGCETKERV